MNRNYTFKKDERKIKKRRKVERNKKKKTMIIAKKNTLLGENYGNRDGYDIEVEHEKYWKQV